MNLLARRTAQVCCRPALGAQFVQVRWKHEKKGFENIKEFKEEQSRKVAEEELAADKEGASRLIQLGLIAITAPLAYYYYRSSMVQDADFKVSEVHHTGKAAIGGDFTLVDTDGIPRTQADFRGKNVILYFGFTHCPEICPVELHRISFVLDALREKHPNKEFVPVFVSCDPKRDCLKEIKSYLSEFHKDFIGLVGTHAQVEDICKKYRIYFSSPSAVEEDEGDYLIDHSIAMYFFDENFCFVDAFGSRWHAGEIIEKMNTAIAKGLM